MKIKELKFNKEIVVIDELKTNDVYKKFISELKKNKIITTEYNKINFVKSNVSVIYNVNDYKEDYNEIIEFKERYKSKLKKHNIKLVLLNRNNDTIYHDKRIIICHSKLIKKIFKLDYYNVLITYLIKNNKPIKKYTEFLICDILSEIVKNGKLNKKCFDNVYDHLIHNKFNFDITYLNKSVIVKIKS